MAERAALLPVLAEVRELARCGWKFVLVHGAGPQAGAMQQRLGLVTTKVAGRRVTDDATLQVVKQVLGGEVNLDLVAAALEQGLDAIGLSGVSGSLIEARRVPPQPTPDSHRPVDYGHVGEVSRVRTELVERLWAGGLTPVVSPLGVSEQPDANGRRGILNINADTAAAAIASALRVDHLFLMTAVPGVLRSLDDPTSRIPRLTPTQAAEAIATGTVHGGMIVKVQDAVQHLQAGIAAVHILAPGPGALTAEALQPGCLGTVLVPDEPGRSDTTAPVAAAPSDGAGVQETTR